ncbi:hypothetical protein [Burkholderia sp. PU8-34]
MTVKELMEALSTAAPEARVLFLGFGADLDEAVEVSAVCSDRRPWTHEDGAYGRGRYEVYYRGAPVVREAGYSDVNTQSVRVVLLSEDAPFLASRIADDDRLSA